MRHTEEGSSVRSGSRRCAINAQCNRQTCNVGAPVEAERVLQRAQREGREESKAAGGGAPGGGRERGWGEPPA